MVIKQAISVYENKIGLALCSKEEYKPTFKFKDEDADVSINSNCFTKFILILKF